MQINTTGCVYPPPRGIPFKINPVAGNSMINTLSWMMQLQHFKQIHFISTSKDWSSSNISKQWQALIIWINQTYRMKRFCYGASIHKTTIFNFVSNFVNSSENNLFSSHFSKSIHLIGSISFFDRCFELTPFQYLGSPTIASAENVLYTALSKSHKYFFLVNKKKSDP